jgi:hypothetical protein
VGLRRCNATVVGLHVVEVLNHTHGSEDRRAGEGRQWRAIPDGIVEPAGHLAGDIQVPLFVGEQPWLIGYGIGRALGDERGAVAARGSGNGRCR